MMPHTKLTAKQEAFAQAIADGMTQADAYRTAYEVKKMTDNAIYREASVLISSPNIAQRVAELKAAIAEKQLWTREQSVNELITAVGIAKANGKPAEIVAAIKELNLMHGYNAPQQVELSGGVAVKPVFNIIGVKAKGDDD